MIPERPERKSYEKLLEEVIKNKNSLPTEIEQSMYGRAVTGTYLNIEVQAIQQVVARSKGITLDIIAEEGEEYTASDGGKIKVSQGYKGIKLTTDSHDDLGKFWKDVEEVRKQLSQHTPQPDQK